MPNKLRSHISKLFIIRTQANKYFFLQSLYLRAPYLNTDKQFNIHGGTSMAIGSVQVHIAGQRWEN